MTIRKRLYISFSLILLIIIFIIGVFFYATYNLNELHLAQNHRYEQIRKVEKLKEYNNTLTWIALDIIADKDKIEIVKKGIDKAKKLFVELDSQKIAIVNNSESQNEIKNILSIFTHFKQIEKLLIQDLNQLIVQKEAQIDFVSFNSNLEKTTQKINTILTEEIIFLQEKLDKTEKDKDEFINKIILELVVLLFLAFLLSFFISSKLINEIKSMLDKLNKGVLQLLNNDENTIKIDIDKNNELSEITNNLNLYLEKQDDIIHSREELLRNISHELKTPITKGKFLLENLKESKGKNVIENINNVFHDIEELTSSLLQREKLNFATLTISKFKVSSLILEALSKLSIDDESKIILEIENDFDIEGDLYYLTMALKNLIDNAMKYTNEYPVKIKSYNNTLYVENIAKKLSNNLIYYIQPFTREPNQQLGHGLGLNIVNKIIQLHNFRLDYMHKNSYNVFYILFK
jgi:two-component system OmpR family sensor kinase